MVKNYKKKNGMWNGRSSSKDLKSVCQNKVDIVIHKVQMNCLCLGEWGRRNVAFNSKWEFGINLKL